MDSLNGTKEYHYWVPVGFRSIEKGNGMVRAEILSSRNKICDRQRSLKQKDVQNLNPCFISQTTLNASHTKYQKLSATENVDSFAFVVVTLL